MIGKVVKCGGHCDYKWSECPISLETSSASERGPYLYIITALPNFDHVENIFDIEEAKRLHRALGEAIAHMQGEDQESCPRYGAPCPHPTICVDKCTYAYRVKEDE